MCECKRKRSVPQTTPHCFTCSILKKARQKAMGLNYLKGKTDTMSENVAESKIDILSAKKGLTRGQITRNPTIIGEMTEGVGPNSQPKIFVPTEALPGQAEKGGKKGHEGTTNVAESSRSESDQIGPGTDGVDDYNL